MARTVKEIYDEIITEKETMSSLNGLLPVPDDSQTFLDDLATTSKVAVWRVIVWIVAYAISIHEQLWDVYEIKINDLALSKQSGTARWYQQQALLFQSGDPLTWNGSRYVYDPVDVSAQIVKRSAVTESGGIVSMKVAKLSGGLPAALSGAELTAFNAYMDKVKFAGTWLNVVSLDADEIDINLKVYFDPQVIAADGSLISDGAVFPVEDAINDYIQELPFNGTFRVTEMIDAIQNAEGVTDPYFVSAQARPDGGSFIAVTETYVASAGHMVIDPANPLNTTITYVPA